MRKILIVEDDNDIAMLERDYLEIAGFSPAWPPMGMRRRPPPCPVSTI